MSWVLWCLEDTAVSLVYVALKFPGLLQCELHVGSQKKMKEVLGEIEAMHMRLFIWTALSG